MNIYDTYYMLAVVEELPLEQDFFRRRYFPTNNALDIFTTSKVLADYREGSKKMAPFVLPRVGSVPVTREGFDTYALEPANISISIPLTVDQLKKRSFGEALMPGKTPEQREKHYLASDLSELSAMISRAEELLAVNTILNNGTIMRHRTDKEGIYEDIGVNFYDGADNPSLFTPATSWTHSSYNSTTKVWTVGSFYSDICAMVKSLTRSGRPVSEIVVSSDVADFLMCDPWILEVLNNRRIEIGRISPEELGEFAYVLGYFNFDGRTLPIIVYEGSYENSNKQDVQYLQSGTVIVTAADSGRGLYGGVTQIDDNGNMHTYAGMRIPDHIFTKRPPVRETQLSCCPLFVPKRANPWRVAKNVL